MPKWASLYTVCPLVVANQRCGLCGFGGSPGPPPAAGELRVLCEKVLVVHVDRLVEFGPVVHAGPVDVLVAQDKAEGLDQVKPGAGGHAGPPDRPGVEGDLRLMQHDVDHVRLLECLVAHHRILIIRLPVGAALMVPELLLHHPGIVILIDVRKADILLQLLIPDTVAAGITV